MGIIGLPYLRIYRGLMPFTGRGEMTGVTGYPSALSVRGVECVNDLSRNAATRGDGMPIFAGPLADRGALFAIDACRLPTRAQAATAAATATHLPGMLNPGAQLFAELLGILRRKVYFVSNAIDAEFNGFVGSGFAIDIINEGYGDLLGHLRIPYFEWSYWSVPRCHVSDSVG
ncbi:hypothetical protein L835_3754 [Mycobacteroides abscessus MAB_110811_1470]|nr:hypothetical protein L835_3754 [Mycobacteroides abscessus MAB_110811_1470]